MNVHEQLEQRAARMRQKYRPHDQASQEGKSLHSKTARWTVQELSKLTGASRASLAWWELGGDLKPAEQRKARHGMTALYSRSQVYAIRRAMRLWRAGLDRTAAMKIAQSTRDVRPILKALELLSAAGVGLVSVQAAGRKQKAPLCPRGSR